MKGVSTLVVVILLLLITISLVGFVFIFFQRSATQAAGQAEEQQEQVQSSLGKTIRIDNVAVTTVIVRHTGTVALNLTAEATVYVNNVAAACTNNWGAFQHVLLQTGNTATCTLGSPCTGQEVKVTTPGGSATDDC